MFGVFRRLWGEKKSGDVARERMRFVLMHDRLDLTPEVLEKIKNDILAVLSRYMDIDQNTLQVDFKQGKDYAALMSNVHVKRVYRKEDGTEASEEA